MGTIGMVMDTLVEQGYWRRFFSGCYVSRFSFGRGKLIVAIQIAMHASSVISDPFHQIGGIQNDLLQQFSSLDPEPLVSGNPIQTSQADSFWLGTRTLTRTPTSGCVWVP
jgi:hypothetical protein